MNCGTIGLFLDKEISWRRPQQKVSHVKIGEIILKLQHIS